MNPYFYSLDFLMFFHTTPAVLRDIADENNQ